MQDVVIIKTKQADLFNLTEEYLRESGRKPYYKADGILVYIADNDFIDVIFSDHPKMEKITKLAESGEGFDFEFTDIDTFNSFFEILDKAI